MELEKLIDELRNERHEWSHSIDQIKILVRAVRDNDYYEKAVRDALLELTLRNLEKLQIFIEGKI